MRLIPGSASSIGDLIQTLADAAVDGKSGVAVKLDQIR
jgi:hypothetical protein